MSTPQDRYRMYLETLTFESLLVISTYVTENVHFKDPFNDIRGVDAMSLVFGHMFENVQDIKFEVQEILAEGQVCLMAWHFNGRINGDPWSFDGTSVVRFADDGRVMEQIDYWDVGRDFYERLPFIGRLISSLRRRVSAH
jgi:steroid delta-isomerase